MGSKGFLFGLYARLKFEKEGGDIERLFGLVAEKTLLKLGVGAC